MARAHNADVIHVEVHGCGPAVVLFNADPRPPEHPAREQLLRFRDGMIAGLADRFSVVLTSYPGSPKIGTLTPDAVTCSPSPTRPARGGSRSGGTRGVR